MPVASSVMMSCLGGPLQCRKQGMFLNVPLIILEQSGMNTEVHEKRQERRDKNIQKQNGQLSHFT